MEIVRRIVGGLWDILEASAFAGGLFLVTYLFFFQTTSVIGSSSYPTVKQGEMFITERVSYHFESPQRGDFVVIHSPFDTDIEFIKRVIGLPGETVLLKSGNVFINGSQLNESSYLQPDVYTGPESYLKENIPLSIPSGYYFLMGDNRPGSSDSRDFGPISKSSIVGKVFLRYWPPDRFGPLSP